MQASFYITVRNDFSIRGSSAWWSCSRMVGVAALDIQVSLQSDGHVGQHNVGENAQ